MRVYRTLIFQNITFLFLNIGEDESRCMIYPVPNSYVLAGFLKYFLPKMASNNSDTFMCNSGI